MKPLALIIVASLLITGCISGGVTSEEEASTKPQIRTEAWADGPYTNSEGQFFDEVCEPHWLRIYDRHGQQLAYEQCFNRPCNPEWSFEYDDRGNITRFTWTEQDSPPRYSEIYEYDIEDRITKIIHKGTTAFYSYSLTYEYDVTGSVSKETMEKTNEPIEYTTYEKDDEGNLIVSFEVDGNRFTKRIHKYDDYNNEIEVITSVGHYEENILKTYDENGNIFGKTRFDTFVDSDAVQPGYYTTYNENGNEIRHISYMHESIRTYNYIEFDEFGNWTERLQTSHSLPDGTKNGEGIMYRILTYY